VADDRDGIFRYLHDQAGFMRFVQPELIIHAGATVEWTNDDPSMPHT